MDLFGLRFSTIVVECPDETVVVATLNRQHAMNSMTATMFAELEELAAVVDDDEKVRVLILTGAGEKAFCAGYDLAAADSLPSLGALPFLELQELAARSISAIRSLRIPVIAAVNGAAAGGGLALALAADIRLASPSAKFNCAMVKIGLHAGDLGISWTLPRIIGPARAAEVSYTGRAIGADEAERIGLVNRVVPADELLDESRALADTIAAHSPGGVQLSKRALYANMEASSFAAAVELENRGQALLTRTEDMAEALAALRERRAPTFTAR